MIMSTPLNTEDEEGYGDDEEYEEEEDEEEEMEESPRGRQQQPRKGAANDWHYADRRRRMRARTSNSMGIAGLIKGAAKVRVLLRVGLDMCLPGETDFGLIFRLTRYVFGS